MALELGPHQIRVNAVNPTVVLTEMGRLGWSDKDKASNMISKIPMARFAGLFFDTISLNNKFLSPRIILM